MTTCMFVYVSNMQMPGRKPSIVRKLFSPAPSSGKIKKMACDFCKTAVADNGKRMTDHISVCKKCPDKVKAKYCSNSAPSSSLPPSEQLTEVTEHQSSSARSTRWSVGSWLLLRVKANLTCMQIVFPLTSTTNLILFWPCLLYTSPSPRD